ncbi:hypothetical protein BRC92_08815 [Halobacteriales archaeon QS_4_69_31]|nr:MAG: hypothetical protein BRC92_08815 [Halobacteriales archaeon QS_4_69_31]
MDIAGWMRENLFLTITAFVFGATLTAVSVGGAFFWLVFAALGGGGVASTLGTLLPLFVLGVVVGVPLSVVAAAGVGYGLVSRLSAHASESLTELGASVARTAEVAEREHWLARAFGIADLAGAVDPRSPADRAQDRVERVKGRYVDGELTEAEFEREVRKLLAEEDVSREEVWPLDDQLDTQLGVPGGRDVEYVGREPDADPDRTGREPDLDR